MKNAIVSRIEYIKRKKELEAKNFEIIQVRVKQRKKNEKWRKPRWSIEYHQM